MNGTSPPVTFSYGTFVAMFPEFSALTSDQVNGYFIRATTSICANSCSNPAYGDGNLTGLVYLATAHVAWLNCPRDDNGNPAATGQPGSPLVGRISSAQEGSVNVQSEWEVGGTQTQFDAYMQQSKYGVEYLSGISVYRTARYLPLRRPVVLGGVYPGFWRY